MSGILARIYEPRRGADELKYSQGQLARDWYAFILLSRHSINDGKGFFQKISRGILARNCEPRRVANRLKYCQGQLDGMPSYRYLAMKLTVEKSFLQKMSGSIARKCVVTHYWRCTVLFSLFFLKVQHIRVRIWKCEVWIKECCAL